MTLIEFFDKDTIKNILAVLTLKPEKVIYIYDSEIADRRYFDALKKCFKRHSADMILETVPVDNNSVNDIYGKICDVIKKHESCMIELTGGSELMMIAGYKAGLENGIKMLYTDIANSRILDIEDAAWSVDTAVLTLDDFIDAKGAAYAGELHDEPQEDKYESILNVCGYIFRHLREWRFTCTYIQSVSTMIEYGMQVSSNIPFYHKDGKKYRPNREMMEVFAENGFIKNLNMTDNKICFSYAFPEAKTYLGTYGLWLEMFVFINAKRTERFSDVKLGTMIDWDAYDSFDSAGNEIDVILMEKSIPVFVSCKLRGITTPDINELYIQRKRLGGWFSKGVIVTSGDDKTKETGVFKKAEEFGIMVLDKKDIRSGNFGELLVRTVSAQDIVGMKWKRV